jgi:hypothetical protein
MAYLPVSTGRRPRPPGWQVDPGPYRLLVGRSSADIAHTAEVAVEAASPS